MMNPEGTQTIEVQVDDQRTQSITPGNGNLMIEPPEAVGDLWFNLLNNLWNTNFRLWNEGPMGYRFRMDFRSQTP